MEQPELLLAAFALAGLTYYLAGLMMALPKEEWVAWGHVMRNDSIIAMFAIGSVSAIQLLIGFVQQMIIQSGGSDLISSNQAYLAIMAQLVAIDTAMITVVGFVSVMPTLAGFAIILGHMFGPAVFTVTSAIIFWTMIQIIGQIITVLFLTLFSIGLLLWSMPFQIGKAAGSSIIAVSIVLFVGLPLAAPIAVWLQGYIITSDDISELTRRSEILENADLLDPDYLTKYLFVNISDLVARVVGSVVVALLVFPFLYMTLLGIFAKAIANLIGGSSRLTSFRRFGLSG